MITTYPQSAISNANKRGIKDSFGPIVMRGGLSGFTRSLFLSKVIQKEEPDGRLKEVETPILAQGVIQPLGQRQIDIKPEGQRAWQWFTIHATTDLVLKTEDLIVYKGERYRVMSTGTFDDYGYVKYEVVKAYGPKPSI